MTMPARDAETLAAASRALEGAPPEAILAWAFAEFAPRIAISTAFGVEGCALVAMAVGIEPRVQVFTVDTGQLFPESVALRQRLAERYGIEITVLRPEAPERLGLALWARDADACCAARKVEPTRRALAGLDAWITGLRRDQGPSRAGIQILERYTHDDGSPLVKVNPLARWTRNDTWRYVLENDVPYNELLDQGYKSIGCWPCTQSVAAADDERAGRWSGSAKTECGIHTFLARAG
jgi:phosphoadenosine phosphosulfate reductase